MRLSLVRASVCLALLGACAQVRAAPDHNSVVSQQTHSNPDLAGLRLDGDGYLPIPSDQMWCEYKCANFPGRWRAEYATDVYATPALHPQVVSQLSPGEYINAVRYERRVRPRRGVVERAGHGLAVGEVVYMIGGTEDTVLLIRHGATFELPFDEGGENAEIAFEGEYDSVDWVFVERSDGRSNGWLRNPMMPGVEFPLEE